MLFFEIDPLERNEVMEHIDELIFFNRKEEF